MNPAPPRPSRQLTRPSLPPRHQGRSVAATLAVPIGLAALLAGCGAGHATGAASALPSTSATRSGSSSRPAAYAQCMRSHGVPHFPDPVNGHIILSPSSGIVPSSPGFRAASRACASLAPAGPAPSSSAGAARRASPSASVTTATWRDFGQWLAARAAVGRFSGAVLVARNRRTLLDAGYGLADRATATANTSRTKFCIASIGKLFTAVAIAQLAQSGRLSFGDTVGRYLTGFAPAVAGHVTIADLLDMTSGLGDVALNRARPPVTLSAQIKLIARERPQSTPGSAFRYSNDGYIVLGAIIEHVTGQSYASYVRGHILRPAGMTDTSLDPYTPAQVVGMAHGYASIGTTIEDISDRLQVANPSGGAVSTVGDLLRFAQAVRDHTLLSTAMTRTVLKGRVNAPQPGGPAVDQYTYGFASQAINGITFVGHNGGTPGYEGEIDIYPATGYVVVILTNQDRTMVPAIQRSEALLTSS